MFEMSAVYRIVVRSFLLAVIVFIPSSTVRAQNMSCPTPQDIQAGKTKCEIVRTQAPVSALPKMNSGSLSNLKDVIAAAIERHPQIIAARYRVKESLAGIDVAKANGKFQLEGNVGFGGGAAAQTQERLNAGLFQSPDAAWRRVALSQLHDNTDVS